MWKLAPALALMLAGCWQVAVVGDQLTTGGSGSSGGRSASTGTGTGGHHTSGSSTGRATSGTSTGKSGVCGPCAPGATCDAGVCTCTGATDGVKCDSETHEMVPQFCIEGTCATCNSALNENLYGDQCLITLTFNQSSPSCIAVDSTSVYWTDAQGVWKVPIVDVRKPVPVALPQLLYSISNPRCLAIDAYYVYFTVIDGTVREVPLDGGEAITLASLQAEPYAIAVDGEHIYWTDYRGNKVMRLMKTAAPVVPEVIADAVDGGGPFGIWINSSSVFWTNADNGEILMAPLDGGDPTIIANMQTQPHGIVVDATSVYWTNNYGAGQVVKGPLAGPLNDTDWKVTGQGGAGIAVDSEFVYWTNNSCSSDCVLRVPLGGGPFSSVFPGESSLGPLTKEASGIGVDSENLYWTIADPFFGSVYELTPK